MTWYAWTEIRNGKDGKLNVVKPGESVTANKLGVDEDEWDEMVEARVVRETKYPEIPGNFTGSVRDWVLQERRRQLADIDDLEDSMAAAEVAARHETEDVVEVAPEPEENE